MAEQEQERRRSIDADKQEIMAAVQQAVTRASAEAAAAATELAIARHQNQCPILTLQGEHERMYKEIFNGDDGKTGIAYESRTFFAEWRTTKANKRKFWGSVAAIAGILVVLLAEPIQGVWKKVDALMDLAGEAPTLIKLTEDWQKYYENPPQQTPATAPPSDSHPKLTPKKKPSYFRQPMSYDSQQPAQDAQILRNP
jgi:hypothetical protein